MVPCERQFKMNGNRQVEVHYIDNGFPYTVTQSFMDLFEGLSYTQADVALAEALQDQGNPYWSMMHTSSYKYGFSLSASNPYYGFSHAYEINDYMPRLDGGRRVLENPAPSNTVDLPQPILHGLGISDANASPNTEDCIRANPNTSSPQQVIWQDNIDPDNMTYEELLDLGEAVGTQSRGLSQDKISSLPVTKYRCSFFSRKKGGERCVICQMDYKRGDRQMTLPCKHVYHSGCVSRWLSINKACPVCFIEVAGEEPTRQYV